jgi:hypothetical protein
MRMERDFSKMDLHSSITTKRGVKLCLQISAGQFVENANTTKKGKNQMTYFLHKNKVSLIHQSVFHAFIKLKPLPQKMNTIEQFY